MISCVEYVSIAKEVSHDLQRNMVVNALYIMNGVILRLVLLSVRKNWKNGLEKRKKISLKQSILTGKICLMRFN